MNTTDFIYTAATGDKHDGDPQVFKNFESLKSSLASNWDYIADQEQNDKLSKLLKVIENATDFKSLMDAVDAIEEAFPDYVDEMFYREVQEWSKLDENGYERAYMLVTPEDTEVCAVSENYLMTLIEELAEDNEIDLKETSYNFPDDFNNFLEEYSDWEQYVEPIC